MPERPSLECRLTTSPLWTRYCVASARLSRGSCNHGIPAPLPPLNHQVSCPHRRLPMEKLANQFWSQVCVGLTRSRQGVAGRRCPVPLSAIHPPVSVSSSRLEFGLALAVQTRYTAGRDTGIVFSIYCAPQSSMSSGNHGMNPSAAIRQPACVGVVHDTGHGRTAAGLTCQQTSAGPAGTGCCHLNRRIDLQNTLIVIRTDARAVFSRGEPMVRIIDKRVFVNSRVTGR